MNIYMAGCAWLFLKIDLIGKLSIHGQRKLIGRFIKAECLFQCFASCHCGFISSDLWSRASRKLPQSIQGAPKPRSGAAWLTQWSGCGSYLQV